MARTETVTVVFTDLVSSTELASRLGHDAYEALRHEHFTALRTAVAKHDGVEAQPGARSRSHCHAPLHCDRNPIQRGLSAIRPISLRAHRDPPLRPHGGKTLYRYAGQGRAPGKRGSGP